MSIDVTKDSKTIEHILVIYSVKKKKNTIKQLMISLLL